KALTRIEQEKKRVLLYLNPSTLEKLMQTCDKTLIECHLDKYYSEFNRLLDASAFEDLSCFNQLISLNVIGNEQLKRLFENFIHAQGQDAIKRCGECAALDPKQFVTTILTLRQKYSSFVEKAFNNDIGY